LRRTILSIVLSRPTKKFILGTFSGISGCKSNETSGEQEHANATTGATVAGNVAATSCFVVKFTVTSS
jgi:hypothetical protein